MVRITSCEIKGSELTIMVIEKKFNYNRILQRSYSTILECQKGVVTSFEKSQKSLVIIKKKLWTTFCNGEEW